MFTQNTKLILIAGLLAFSGLVNGASLQDLRFAELPGAKAEIRMLFDSVPNAPQGYTIEQPARIVLDFSSTTNSLAQKKYSVSVGDVDSAVVLDAGGKTRLIVNLSNLAPYTTRLEGNELIVEIGADVSKSSAVAAHSPAGVVLNNSPEEVRVGAGSAISLVDFRRGEVGEEIGRAHV